MPRYTVTIDQPYERGESPGNPVGGLAVDASTPEEAVSIVRATLAQAVLTTAGKVYRPPIAQARPFVPGPDGENVGPAAPEFVGDADTSLRPRPGETAAQTLDRVLRAVRAPDTEGE